MSDTLHQRGLRGGLVAALAVAMTLFHLAAASPFVILPNLVLRGTHLLFALWLVWLIWPLARGRTGRAVDLVLMMATAVCLGYLVWFNASIVVRPPWTQSATPVELAVALGTVLLVLEATRRTLGWAVVGLCLVFIAYGFVGPHLRAIDALRPLAHRGVTLDQFVDQMYFSFEGIFGIALGVSTDFIFLFVLFGALLQAVGGGDFFIRVTRAITGASRGGPAKMAVIASGLMGMMSGSSVANVATTGSLTIPLMKRLGYRKEFAGAVEAVASVGGQITPPIMGASAFLMAAIIGISYVEVAAAAALPALLYFAALLLTVHFEALRAGLPALAAEERGSFVRALGDGWTFVLPLVVMIGSLMQGFTPSYCAFLGVLSVLVVPYLRRATWVRPTVLLDGIEQGVRGAVVVAIACASAGIIVGLVQISGLGFRFSSLVVDFAGGSLVIALFLAMIAAFIFGMGMPTTPAYVIQATLVVPALMELGADKLAAHLFVFYFAVLGQITPPVAVAAFAAAPIAGASAARVGIQAFVIGIPAYLIPFLFVVYPSLIGGGDVWSLLTALTRVAIGIACLAGATIGWIAGAPMGLVGRLALVVTAGLMLWPAWPADVAAAVLIALTLFGRRLRRDAA